jgi:hypothetical protein
VLPSDGWPVQCYRENSPPILDGEPGVLRLGNRAGFDNG